MKEISTIMLSYLSLNICMNDESENRIKFTYHSVKSKNKVGEWIWWRQSNINRRNKNEKDLHTYYNACILGFLYKTERSHLYNLFLLTKLFIIPLSLINIMIQYNVYAKKNVFFVFSFSVSNRILICPLNKHARACKSM